MSKGKKLQYFSKREYFYISLSVLHVEYVCFVVALIMKYRLLYNTHGIVYKLSISINNFL